MREHDAQVDSSRGAVRTATLGHIHRNNLALPCLGASLWHIFTSRKRYLTILAAVALTLHYLMHHIDQLADLGAIERQSDITSRTISGHLAAIIATGFYPADYWDGLLAMKQQILQNASAIALAVWR